MLENHVHDEEGIQRSVPLRRAPSEQSSTVRTGLPFSHPKDCSQSHFQSVQRCNRSVFGSSTSNDDIATDGLSQPESPRLDTSFQARRPGSPQLTSDEALQKTTCSGTESHIKSTRSLAQLHEMHSSL